VKTESKLELLNKVTLVTAGFCHLQLLLLKLHQELELFSMKIHTMTMVLSKLTCLSITHIKFKLLLMIDSQLDGMDQIIRNHISSLTMENHLKELGG